MEVRGKTVSGSDLQDAIMELAHVLGWRVAHFRPARTQGGWRTPVAGDGKGFPDLVLVRERVVYAEIKREREALRPEQELWRDWLAAAGQEYYVWRPQDWFGGRIERVLGR